MLFIYPFVIFLFLLLLLFLVFLRAHVDSVTSATVVGPLQPAPQWDTRVIICWTDKLDLIKVRGVWTVRWEVRCRWQSGQRWCGEERGERREAAEGGEARQRGRWGGRAAVFDGGQETSRVMNFSAGCIRGVTRTRTGVRKQVVADICSAQGPWCPCHPLTLTLSLLSFHPTPPAPPLPQCCRPEPDCWIVSRCRREAERQKMRVKQFFFPLSLFFLFFFVVSHLAPAGLQHQR